jgi:hypothetical protein
VLKTVELHVQLVDVVERQNELRETLLCVPGVHSVGNIAPDDVSAQANVTVGYDGEVTNPILIEDRLREHGFVVISAAGG